MASLDEFQARLLAGTPLSQAERSFVSQVLYSVQTAGQMARDTRFQQDPMSWLVGIVTSVVEPFAARFPLPPDELFVAWLEVWPEGGRLSVREGSEQQPGRLVADMTSPALRDTGTASAELWARGYLRLGRWTTHQGGMFSIYCRPNILPAVVAPGTVLGGPSLRSIDQPAGRPEPGASSSEAP